MDKIEKIKRIKVDLLKLKPIEDQKNVYESYKKFLAQYFDEGLPDEKYFTSINCPLCDSNNDRTLAEIDSFFYIRCGNCSAIYNSPRIKKDFLEKMYREGEYNNYVTKLTMPGNEIRKNVTEVRKVEQVQSLFNNKGRILDVGCGAGVFLNIAQESGWNCTGIELSSAGSSAASEKGVNRIEKSFDDYETDKKFACITFWGVLEHVVNPIEQITKAASMLKKGGVIVFEVPSADSLLMQYVVQHGLVPYRFIESARHLTFFSHKSIDMICKEIDLSLEFIESNGLDIQTILLQEFEDEIIEKIMKIQQLVDENLLSDHYRVFLRKKE